MSFYYLIEDYNLLSYLIELLIFQSFDLMTI